MWENAVSKTENSSSSCQNLFLNYSIWFKQSAAILILIYFLLKTAIFKNDSYKVKCTNVWIITTLLQSKVNRSIECNINLKAQKTNFNLWSIYR